MFPQLALKDNINEFHLSSALAVSKLRAESVIKRYDFINVV